MIGQAYIDTVRLLLRVVPVIFKHEISATKGVTAITLFVQAMPRLPVVLYVPDAYLPPVFNPCSIALLPALPLWRHP